MTCGALCGCVAEPLSIAGVQSELSASERRTRAEVIRDAAQRRGLMNGLLLAGIASAETGLAHCWSEATWACQGPHSADCGGPVIAGSADGPCADEQGGLGMFQFDGGTYDQTLEREGDRILSIAGNVDAAVDFVVSMVRRSTYIDGVDTVEEALNWMNEVRPWNELFHPWIQTVTHYYNGCIPGRCSVYESRYASYRDKCTDMLEEMGTDFWYGASRACGPIPADGGTVDETDACFVAGGPSRYWRTAEGGYEGRLLWTNATDNDSPANFAMWNLLFVEAGDYRVEVYTDTAWAESRQAAYQVTHAAGTDSIRLDQTAVDGYQELGIFAFGTGDDQRVRVDDNSGEPNRDEIAIVADALRVTRIAEEMPAPEPPNMMPPMDEFAPDASVRRLPQGGCAVGGVDRESYGGPLFLLMVLLVGRSVRRRRPS